MGGCAPLAKFHLDPSNRLATIHQRYRQTDRQDRQRTNSIARTVLQIVAQKSVKISQSYSQTQNVMFFMVHCVHFANTSETILLSTTYNYHRLRHLWTTYSWHFHTCRPKSNLFSRLSAGSLPHCMVVMSVKHKGTEKFVCKSKRRYAKNVTY